MSEKKQEESQSESKGHSVERWLKKGCWIAGTITYGWLIFATMTGYNYQEFNWANIPKTFEWVIFTFFLTALVSGIIIFPSRGRNNFLEKILWSLLPAFYLLIAIAMLVLTFMTYQPQWAEARQGVATIFASMFAAVGVGISVFVSYRNGEEDRKSRKEIEDRNNVSDVINTLNGRLDGIIPRRYSTDDNERAASYFQLAALYQDWVTLSESSKIDGERVVSQQKNILKILFGTPRGIYENILIYSRSDLEDKSLNSIIKEIFPVHSKSCLVDEHQHFDLSYLDLRGLDFSGKCLIGSEFSGANLEGANLKNTNLSNAVFRMAILDDAILDGAILHNVDFSDARLPRKFIDQKPVLLNTRFDSESLHLLIPQGLGLRYVSFRGSDLRGLGFHGANLMGLDLRESDLSGADLSGADLRGADLRGADLRESNLRGADLRGADLRGADLSGADLRESDLSGADLSGVDLSDAKFQKANLSAANLKGAKMLKTDLLDANLSWANFSDANLQGARLDGVLCEGAYFKNAILNYVSCVSAEFFRADFSFAHLEFSNLQGAHFDRSICISTHFENANAVDTYFKEAILNNAYFENADLWEAHLEGADLSNANLSKLKLSQGNTIQYSHGIHVGDNEWRGTVINQFASAKNFQNANGISDIEGFDEILIGEIIAEHKRRRASQEDQEPDA